MHRYFIAFSIYLFSFQQSNAQLRVMKLIGNNTKQYSLGFGAFIKTGFPIAEASFLTLELGANYFPVKGSGLSYGTAMYPLKAGYRYTTNGSGEGFYIEPQLGYNLLGVSSLEGENGETIDLRYNGMVLAAGGGYLFSIGNTPFDVNLRYETVIAHGGSNNLISFGITRFFSIGGRNKY